MAIVAKGHKDGFSAAPEGLWPAVCCDVVDLGVVTSQWGESHQVEIRWQLSDNDPQSNKPFMVVRRFRLSLHEKSKLRPLLEAWRGRKFTAEELDGFDLEKLIGANCQVQVIHAIKANGGTFANLQAIVPSAKGAQKITVRDYIRVCDRQENHNGADHNEITDEDIPF